MAPTLLFLCCLACLPLTHAFGTRYGPMMGKTSFMRTSARLPTYRMRAPVRTFVKRPSYNRMTSGGKSFQSSASSSASVVALSRATAQLQTAQKMFAEAAAKAEATASVVVAGQGDATPGGTGGALLPARAQALAQIQQAEKAYVTALQEAEASVKMDQQMKGQSARDSRIISNKERKGKSSWDWGVTDDQDGAYTSTDHRRHTQSPVTPRTMETE